MWSAVKRFARVIAVEVARQGTRPADGRRFVMDTEADRKGYFDLLRHHVQEQQMSQRPALAQLELGRMKHGSTPTAAFLNEVHKLGGGALCAEQSDR